MDCKIERGLRRAWWVGLAAAALTVGCAAPPPATTGAAAPAADEASRSEQDVAAVIAAHRAFVTAYQQADAPGVTALLDATPELLLFHPYLENRFHGVEEARAGLERMFARVGTPTWTEAHPAAKVRGDVGWITYHVALGAAALESPFAGRGTEIWVRRGDGWKLIHAHWSEHADVASVRR